MGKTVVYTMQLAKWRLAAKKNIEVVDITAKSGNPAFAPDFENVMKYKRGEMGEEEYTQLYVQKMQESVKANRQDWLNLINRENYALACYCTPGDFCHRHIMRKILSGIAKKLNSEFIYLGELTE